MTHSRSRPYCPRPTVRAMTSRHGAPAARVASRLELCPVAIVVVIAIAIAVAIASGPEPRPIRGSEPRLGRPVCVAAAMRLIRPVAIASPVAIAIWLVVFAVSVVPASVRPANMPPMNARNARCSERTSNLCRGGVHRQRHARLGREAKGDRSCAQNTRDECGRSDGYYF